MELPWRVRDAEPGVFSFQTVLSKNGSPEGPFLFVLDLVKWTVAILTQEAVRPRMVVHLPKGLAMVAAAVMVPQVMRRRGTNHVQPTLSSKALEARLWTP